MNKFIFTFTVAMVLFGITTLQAQQWESDLEVAFKNAQNKNRKVILVFSGSDWCIPCKKLERNIWDSKSFKSYAKEHYVLVRADFPRRKRNKLPNEQQRKNKLLAEKYNPQGHFPFVVVFNKDKRKIGAMGYKKVSPKKYIELLENL